MVITQFMYNVNRINEVKWTEWKTHVSFINEDPGPTGTVEFYDTLFAESSVLEMFFDTVLYL